MKGVVTILVAGVVLVSAWAMWRASRITAPAASTPAAVPEYACMLGTAGADVEVEITQSDSTCAQWVQNLAPTGLNWYFITQMAAPYSNGPADGETMYKVCALSGGSSGNMLVEDAGGAYYGNSICSQEEANGWTPNESTAG